MASIPSGDPPNVDSLNSQTKCNTLVKVLSWESVMDTVTIEERCEIACLQAKGRSVRQIAASFGSLAIDDLSGVEAQWYAVKRVQTQVCR